jgi:hypothetical protein
VKGGKRGEPDRLSTGKEGRVLGFGFDEFMEVKEKRRDNTTKECQGVEDATKEKKPEVLGALSCGRKVGSFLSSKGLASKKDEGQINFGLGHWDVRGRSVVEARACGEVWLLGFGGLGNSQLGEGF